MTFETSDDLFGEYATRYTTRQGTEMSLMEYLELCKTDPSAYMTAPQRMLKAIGDPVELDTSKDQRLSRIFMNSKIRYYPTFAEFYGMEKAIDDTVAYFKHAAQGLEEKKQILYLLGPVGGGKSSLAERIKELMETIPMYVLKADNQMSPLGEHPFGLFDPVTDGPKLEARYGIPAAAFKTIMSPWATKRLKEFGGDVRKFSVVKVYPSKLQRIGIAKAEPGDENNQDISSLVGKVDIRMLEDFSQNDPDAYSYSGALNIATQGIVDYAEMFKSNIKTLNPLLVCTQDGHYNGTEGLASFPFQGIVMAHSNESEWEKFRNNKSNEAFLDRVYIVKVPYCLRVTEEIQIYDKLLKHSSLAKAPHAPGTLEMLAQFSILSRLKKPENSTLFAKMEIYDGKNLKDKDPTAKSYQEYRDHAGVEEGMTGTSTRFAFKVLSKTFNYDSVEIAANPVHLMYVLEQQIMNERLPEAMQEEYISFIKGMIAPKYATFLSDEIQKAYLESYSEYGQNVFDRYIQYADAWIQNIDYRDSDTNEMYDREALNAELEKIEKPAQISNPKDFRNEVVNHVLRAAKNNAGRNPAWTSYEKLRSVIEKKMFANTEELLPVISFNKKATAEEETKHNDFVQRMKKKGYTDKQVRLLVEWYMRYRKHS
jgi:serine protein kinase